MTTPKRSTATLPKVTKVLNEIAKQHLSLSTLEVQMSDGLDFKEHHVSCIKDALIAAYLAGKAARD